MSRTSVTRTTYKCDVCGKDCSVYGGLPANWVQNVQLRFTIRGTSQYSDDNVTIGGCDRLMDLCLDCYRRFADMLKIPDSE